MATHAAPIKIKTGVSLEAEAGATNVALATAERELAKQANVDGKDIAPREVRSQFLSTVDGVFHGSLQSGSMLVGSGGVTVTSDPSGGTPSTGLAITGSKLQLIKDSALVVDLDGTTGDATFKGTVAAGSSIAGDMTAGSIAIGAGGVTIGNAAAGVSISGNQLRCIVGGVTKVSIDGATGAAYFAGEVAASKFVCAANEDNAFDMSVGSILIGDQALLGSLEAPLSDVLSDVSGAASDAASALAAAVGALEVADGEIVGFYQTSAPGAGSGRKFGDIWIDTDYAGFPTPNAIYRYQDASGGSQGSLDWRQAPTNAIGLVYLDAYFAYTSAQGAWSAANTKIRTYYQANPPTATTVGDMWVDTDDGNKLYRASATGTGNWVAVQDAGAAAGASAVQPGGGVVVDGSRHITTIDMASGIVVRSGSGTTRTQITSAGMAVYRNNVLCVQIDHTNGVWINNNGGASPHSTQRLSFASSGNEWARIYHDGENGYWQLESDDDAILSAGHSVSLVSGTGASDYVRLKRGATTVISFPGNSNLVTFAGGISLGGAITGATSLTATGDVRGVHKTAAGNNKADSTFSFYAASSSGGSPTVQHTVTFTDGLITSWSAS